MPRSAICPDVGDLRRFVLGQSPHAEAEQLENHLAQCASCVEALATLHGQDTLTDAVRGQAKAVAEPDHATVVQLMERLRELRPQTAESADMPTEAPTEGGQPPKENARPDGASDARGQEAATLAPSSIPSASIPDSAHETYDFLAPPEAADEIGRLGHYRILKVLGTGGMGVVFQARDPHLDRLVALKTMLPALAANPAARQRFEREAKAAAAIKHDHIVTIHQVGEDRGVPYLAMEFLEGESLDDRLKRENKLPVADVLRIGREIAEGLAAAHERGLIHRDIKPANIWLENRGQGTGVRGQENETRPAFVLTPDPRPLTPIRVKILDFGLARAAGDTATLTQLGTILGTPAFMAPEQSRNLGVDHRSDLFSLGCVLYRISTGELPFKGTDTMSIVAALALDDPPPPRKLNPEVPTVLSDLVMQLLAKKPDDRPASAGAVALALEDISAKAGDWRTKEGGPATSVHRYSDDDDKTGQFVPVRSRPSRSRRQIVALAAAATILLLGGIIYVATENGRLVIDSKVDDIQVIVSKGGKQYEVIDLKSGTTVKRLPSGDYQITLKNDRTDVKLDKGGFTMTRWGQVIVKVTRETSIPIAGAGLPKEFSNTLGAKFMLISAGKFMMGSPQAEVDHLVKQDGGEGRFLSEGPQHEVEITQPFYMGVTEVTVAQFRQFVEETKYNVGDHRWKNPGFAQFDNHPVVWVSWHDAVAFCDWLSQKEGKKYRLPTEAEWEYCCRAGMSSRYCFGDDETQLADYCWYGGKWGGPTYPVAKKKANDWGLYDMHGNVWEWCQDKYDPGYYKNSPRKDPSGGAGDVHVFRGGSLSNHFRLCRCAFRNYDPGASLPDLGFRIVLVADKKQQAGSGTTKPDWPQAFAPSQPTITKDGVVADQGGWRIDAKEPRTVRLFELPTPGVKDCVLTYRAKLKTKDIEGRAFLEMLCQIAFQGEGWSKGGHNAISGTNDWATYEIPFFLAKGQRADLLKLNLAIEGKGTIWIKDIEVLQSRPKGTTAWPIGPFVILAAAGKPEQAYLTLAEAVAAARDGDTIEIYGNGPIPCAPVTVEKNLVIRAAPGFAPNLSLPAAHKDNKQPLLLVKAPLVLEGVELVRFDVSPWRDEQPSYLPLVGVADTSFHAANCRFTMTRRGGPRGLQAISTDSPTATIHLRNCVLLEGDMFVGLDPPKAILRVENCIVKGTGYAVGRNIYKEPADVRINIHRSTLVGGHSFFFVVMPGVEMMKLPAGGCRIEWTDNVVLSMPLVVGQSVENEPLRLLEVEKQFSQAVKMVGDRNLYSLRDAFSFVYYPPGDKAQVRKGLADWEQLWGRKEAGSRQDQVKFTNYDPALKKGGMTVSDFRLLPGTPGKAAGKGGKDLGAEVDLVGPGGGYDRWKQTADYREWLKNTGQTPRQPEAHEQELVKKYTNSLGMEFALIPKGKSWLGGGGGRPGDKEVEIARDYYLGVYPITQEEWQKVMGHNPSRFSRSSAPVVNAGQFGKDRVKDISDEDLKRFPVDNVSWEDCQKFVAELNDRLKETGWVYRLPTGEEWEYACRGGPMADKSESAFHYYFGKPTNVMLPEQANFGNVLKRPTKVGSYPPNRLGLYDMHGNVWQPLHAPVNDIATGCGGSWYNPCQDCIAAERGSLIPGVGHTPTGRYAHAGLRLARVPVRVKIAPAAHQQELDKLQGRWTLLYHEQNGKRGEIKEILTFNGDRWELTQRDAPYQSGTFKLIDVTAQPKSLDLLITDGDGKGRTITVVYQLDGDSLKYCGLFSDVGLPRPTDFTTQPEDHRFLSVWTRLSPEKKDGATQAQQPNELLKFFVGSWKMEGVIDEPKLPAGLEARATGLQTFELVAGGKFLRGYDTETKGQFETLTVQAWDAEEQAFQGWFFASDGNMTGPAVGTWDAKKALLTWKEMVGDIRMTYELQLVDGNTIKTHRIHRDRDNKIVYEMRQTMTRLEKPAEIQRMALDPKRPVEMKPLDPIVPQWRSHGTVNKAEKPNAAEKIILLQNFQQMLGGRLVECREINESTGEKTYFLTGYDTRLKKYRFWHFSPLYGAQESQGAWDESKKTMLWKSVDNTKNTIEGFWDFRDDYVHKGGYTVRDAKGNLIVELRFATKRVRPKPFVVLAKNQQTEQYFDTLKEAVAQAQGGDTIEIHGNGPFVSNLIRVKKALKIRAAEDYRPVVTFQHEPLDKDWLGMMDVSAPLTLEGIEFRYVRPQKRGVAQLFLVTSDLRMAHCRVVTEGEANPIFLSYGSLQLNRSELLSSPWPNIRWNFDGAAKVVINEFLQVCGRR